MRSAYYTLSRLRLCRLHTSSPLLLQSILCTFSPCGQPHFAYEACVCAGHQESVCFVTLCRWRWDIFSAWNAFCTAESLVWFMCQMQDPLRFCFNVCCAFWLDSQSLLISRSGSEHVDFAIHDHSKCLQGFCAINIWIVILSRLCMLSQDSITQTEMTASMRASMYSCIQTAKEKVVSLLTAGHLHSVPGLSFFANWMTRVLIMNRCLQASPSIDESSHRNYLQWTAMYHWPFAWPFLAVQSCLADRHSKLDLLIQVNTLLKASISCVQSACILSLVLQPNRQTSIFYVRI